MLTTVGYGSEKKLKGIVTQEALDFDNPLFDSRKLSFDGRKHEALSSQQISINPLAKKGALPRVLSNKGGLGVSSRIHSASAGSLTSLDLNNATVISASELKNLVQALKSTEENEAVLARVRLNSNNKLFTSDQLLQLLDVTTSIKTQIEIISILAPNLTDPKSKFEQFVGRYRFAEDKDKVTEYLTDATKKLSSLRFSRHTSLSVRQSRFGSTDSLSGKLVDTNAQRSRFASTESTSSSNNSNNYNNVVTSHKSSFHSGLGSPFATSPSTRPGVTEVDRELYKIDDSHREDSLQSIDCCVLSSSSSSTPRNNESDTNTVIIDAPSVADVKKRISAKLCASGNAHLLSPQKKLAISPRIDDSIKNSSSAKSSSSISAVTPRPVSSNTHNNNSISTKKNNTNNNNTTANNNSSKKSLGVINVTISKAEAAANDIDRDMLKRSSSEETTSTILSTYSDSTTAASSTITTASNTNGSIKNGKDPNISSKKPSSSSSSSPKKESFFSRLKSSFSFSSRKASTVTTTTATTATTEA